MSIDVILPCRNEARALPWVLARMPVGLSPLVVDNGSTDGSAEIARAAGARVVVAARRGYSAACHAGLLAATSDVVLVLDADASLDPHELPALAATACTQPRSRRASRKKIGMMTPVILG